MPLTLQIRDQDVAVDIVSRRPLRISIDGRVHDVVESTTGADFFVIVDGVTHHGHRAVLPDGIWVHFAGRTFVARSQALGADKAGGKGGPDVRSEMPGTVVSVHVAEGAHVKEGDPLVTIESMKLQVSVNSDRDGIVAKLHLAAGATFERGAILLTYAEKS